MVLALFQRASGVTCGGRDGQGPGSLVAARVGSEPVSMAGRRSVPMVLGGLRRAEVLGLRLEDLHLGEWRVFVNEGKGGHQRLVPVSPSFFATVAAYMDTQRPSGIGHRSRLRGAEGATTGRTPLGRGPGRDHERCQSPGRSGSRDLSRASSHLLRTYAEAGMTIEVLQAQAGHRSIASTQLYLHLGDGWLAEEYRRAAEVIEAQASVGMPQSARRRQRLLPRRRRTRVPTDKRSRPDRSRN